MKIVALAAAVLCFAAAALYATGHFPGTGHKHHMTHAIACAVIGVVALVWARMQNASSSAAVSN